MVSFFGFFWLFSVFVNVEKVELKWLINVFCKFDIFGVVWL